MLKLYTRIYIHQAMHKLYTRIYIRQAMHKLYTRVYIPQAIHSLYSLHCTRVHIRQAPFNSSTMAADFNKAPAPLQELGLHPLVCIPFPCACAAALYTHFDSLPSQLIFLVGN